MGTPRTVDSKSGTRSLAQNPSNRVRILSRVALWTLAILVLLFVGFFVLLFHTPPPPVVHSDPGDAAQLTTRIKQAQATASPAAPQVLRVEQNELNSLIASYLGKDSNANADEATLDVSEATFLTGTDPALTAATMSLESNSNLAMWTNETTDVGPMQVNLYWAERGSPSHIYPDALGTNFNKGQNFNGDPVANIETGALLLKELGKHPENYARKDLRPGRRKKLDTLVPVFSNLFNCLYKGGSLGK